MTAQIQSLTPKLIGHLISYPDAELIAACDEIETSLNEESWLKPATLKGVSKLLDYLRTTPLLEVQENYVDLFDRTPSLCLHMFEHIHGESRDRGQALVDLDEVYRDTGLHNESQETPDFLPLFLEYLSCVEPEQARSDMDGAVNVVGALRARLETRESLYAYAFTGLEEIATRRPNKAKIKHELRRASGELPSREELDATWEEQFAFDNTGKDNEDATGACGSG